jgi:peptidoglycan/xylan/chitin deacetylase (PgdA/CDA1 family)
MIFPLKRKKLFSGRGKPWIILLYHHIAVPAADPWEMSVTPEHFREHLEILAEDYLVRPLSSLPDISSRPSTKPVVFISFDDGYLDNFETALPLLLHFRLPAIFFIPTRIFQEDSLFWWEVLEQVLLDNPVPPGPLALQIGNQQKLWEITGREAVEKNRFFSAWKGEATTSLQKIYLELGELLKAGTPSVQDFVKAQLIKWAGTFRADQTVKKMDPVQLKRISEAGLFEIGGHTISHPALGNLDLAAQTVEIREGKTILEKIIGTPLKCFAYPHGNYTPATRQLVRESGFELACTTENAGVTSGTDRLLLPRIWVRNWDGATFRNVLNSCS